MPIKKEVKTRDRKIHKSCPYIGEIQEFLYNSQNEYMKFFLIFLIFIFNFTVKQQVAAEQQIIKRPNWQRESNGWHTRQNILKERALRNYEKVSKCQTGGVPADFYTPGRRPP